MEVDNSFQKKWFNNQGEGWLKHVSNPFYENLMFKLHLPKIEGDVLEIGGGRFSKLLSMLPNTKLTVGDISETMLDNIKNVKAKKVVMDIEKIPFKDNSFDYVVSFGILHHVSDVKKSIQECVRVSRKGVFFLIEMNPLYLPYTSKIILNRETVEWGILNLPIWKYKKILDKLKLDYSITLTDLGNHRMSENFFLFCRKIEGLFKPFLSHINIYISLNK